MNNDLPYVETRSLISPKSSFLIYWAILLFTILGALSLPFVKIEVTTTSRAVIRPDGEKLSIRAIVPGTIDSIKIKEGSSVLKDQIIFTIKNISSASEFNALKTELEQKFRLREDLQRLCKSDLNRTETLSGMLTPAYSMQLGDFISQMNARLTTLKKSEYDLKVAETLFKDSVISSNEYYKHRNENSRLNSEYDAFRLSWKSNWEQQLLTLNFQITDLEKKNQLLLAEKELYNVRAPATGVLIGSNGKYAGSFMQAGEIFGELSPETDLIVECLIPPSEIGMIKKGQKAIIQIDAFDHNYFGSVNGIVETIDDDYTIIQQTQVYRVRCTIDENTLRLKNGYEAKLKKGLTCQVRFIIAKRSVFDLLFDKVEDWLHPSRTREV